ncbi:MAG: hypothetical protein KAS23_06645 [Anaerohalosphaera sp.]|nr:hypothetical protein [Anaerohalosphaera sp.]
MKKSDMIYIIGSVYVTLTGFFYCLTMWFSIQLPRYYPIEHTWKMVKEKGVPSQGWYSKQAFAYICAAAVTFMVYLIVNKMRNRITLKSSLMRSIAVICLSSTVYFLLYIMYYEFHHWHIL